MPIKDKSLYPENWKAIRKAILERDSHRCKVCGLPNHAWIQRHGFLVAQANGTIQHEDAPVLYEGVAPEFPAQSWTLVVLTIAHLDHDPRNSDPANLAALCQLHHNRLDVEQRKASRAETRRQKRAGVV
jgi:hypothetical protein